MARYRSFLILKKEEKWLNSMSKQGWQLCRKSYDYELRRAEAEDTVIRIDYLKFN